MALLVGVSQYQKEFKPLKSPEADVDKIQRILQEPNIGGFDEVIPLINPNKSELEESIYYLFANRNESDLLLFYFSGHGVKNMRGNLFLTLPETTKNQRGEVIRHKAVSATFLQESMTDSASHYQVIILDCCFSGAIVKGLTAKDGGEVDIKGALGRKGRAILTSSTSMQMSFQQDESGLSVYTRYLIEGLETGVADFNNDGWITVDEAHQYASQKVQEKSPAMTPQLFPVEEGYKINLAKAPLSDPLLQYRKEVQRIIDDVGVIDFINGKFDELDRLYLDGLRDELQLDLTDTTEVEKSVMEPLRQRYQKIQRYEKAVSVAVKRSLPLKERDNRRLKDIQNILGLRDEDVEPIHQKLISPPPSPSPHPIITPPQPSTVTPSKPTPVKPQTPQPPFIPSPTPEIELKSSKGVDYTKLKKLLAAGKWKEADEETSNVMLQAANRVKAGYFRGSDIDNFPCEDLRTIDQLWVHYSKGKFGFSVQKKIYVDELGGTRDYNEKIWYEFCDRVGWRTKGLLGMGKQWKGYSDLTFELLDTTPVGHLPSGRLYQIPLQSADAQLQVFLAAAGFPCPLRGACTSLLSRKDL